MPEICNDLPNSALAVIILMGAISMGLVWHSLFLMDKCQELKRELYMLERQLKFLTYLESQSQKES